MRFPAKISAKLLAVVCSAVWIHGAASAQTAVDLAEFPAAEMETLAPRHRDWVERDVYWILTEPERDVFMRLPDDERRDHFIEEFWRQRDPSPGTRRNEYREAHEQRFAEANERFGRGSPRPGWRTDRGRIHILLGEPQSIVPFPNTQLAVPLELWSYAVDPVLGLPPFFYVIFYKPRGFGDYRLYGPVSDGPQELLNEAGRAVGRGNVNAGRAGPLGGPTGMGDTAAMVSVLAEVDPELGNAVLSLIPGSGAGLQTSPLRSELLLARIEDLPRTVMPTGAWALRFLTGAADTAVRFETLTFDARAVGLLDPEGVPFVHYLVRAPARQLNLQNYDGRDYLTFELSRSLLDERRRVLASDAGLGVEIEFDPATAAELRNSDLHYIDRVPAAPGRLALGLTVENTVSGEFGRAEIQVELPGAGDADISASAPVLVHEYQDLGADFDPFGPRHAFQLGRNFVLPVIDGPFASGGMLWIFHQIYAVETPDRPLTASYTLLDQTGAAVATKTSTLPLERRDEHGTLNQLTGLDLEGVAPGSYRLQVEVAIPGRPSDTLGVRVVAPQDASAPFVHAPAGPPPNDPSLLLRRAATLHAAGRRDEALEVGLEILDRDPGESRALDLVVALLAEQERHGEILALLTPRIARAPHRVDLLLEAADAAARSGDHWDAIRYYERARRAGAEETPELLNTLAGEYLAHGDAAAARELLLRSLELRPGQALARSLLDSIESGR